MDSPNITKFWSAYSHVYDGLLRFWPYENLLHLMREEAAVTSGHRLLDLGCGTGNLLSAVLSETPAVDAIGVDISSGMLGIARRKLRRFTDAGSLTLRQDNILDFLADQGDDSADRIVSMNVFYIIKEQDELWREVVRVLKPGGRIVVTTSDRKANWPIIREQFRHGSARRALHPKLLAVFGFDLAIGLMGRNNTLPFNDEAELQAAVERAGGKWLGSQRCYGGAEDGVNILFSVTK